MSSNPPSNDDATTTAAAEVAAAAMDESESTSKTTTVYYDTSNTTTTNPTLYDVIIVGGGLSGAFLARRLHDEQKQKQFLLVEATDRLGGRLRNASEEHQIDMGAAWMWPDFQPHIKYVTEQLLFEQLETFLQPDDAVTTRVCGGAVQLVNKLVAPLPEDSIVCNAPVVSCRWDTITNQITVTTTNNSGSVPATTTYKCRRLVLAAPPRVLHQRVTFDPPLTDTKQAAMAGSHTWMAGCAKIALIYATKFWEYEHSSILISQQGPAFQVYDGSVTAAAKDSTAPTTPALVFLATLQETDGSDISIAKTVAKQLDATWKAYGVTQYDQKAFQYTHFHVQRWNSHAPFCSENPRCMHSHPTPVPALSTPEWENRLWLAGSEVDTKHPGLMEGALGAASRVTAALQQSRNMGF